MYLALIIFIVILAFVDLHVGVSNDAVNFLNSAVGSKAAKMKVIFAIAACGIVFGAVMSNGMMDIARHGIFKPQYFSFSELICIMLGVMMTDVVLLDIFNSLGLPTSTTVSMVFELLGGSVAMAMIKSASPESPVPFADMFNTAKAVQVIIAIFVSVAIAFFFGTIVQFITRLLTTFNYKKTLKWSAGIVGGLAVTAILYFMLIMGIKDASFMSASGKAWIGSHTWELIVIFLAVATLIMQILHLCKVNILKIIVLVGTFALAMAFAGNDLVNFIGVPLAALSSYTDFTANGGGLDPDFFMMGSLNEPASTPVIILLVAGLFMVFALVTSKKSRNVVKTSLDLSRQSKGDESFRSNRLARFIVRISTKLSIKMLRMTPPKVRTWVNSRFDNSKEPLPEGASFDLVRASVNLVLASILIAIGTSNKLPLSTTYVTFMVAMGSSLADRAWTRESAASRITGVFSVIMGWFVTAAAAFIICFFATVIMQFGGFASIIILCGVTVYLLVHTRIGAKTSTKTGSTESNAKPTSKAGKSRLADVKS